MTKKLKSFLYLDLRSLALFRILLGALLIKDIVDRLPYLATFYSDYGVFPRTALILEFGRDWMWSLFSISGQPVIVLLLMLFTILVSFLLMIGWRTKLMSVLAWVMFASLYARNPISNHGGDDVIRMALFWAMFLPLGQYFSVDALKNKIKVTDNTILSLPGFFFISQIVIIYFFTGILKSHPIWTTEGSAIWYTLQLESFVKQPIGGLLKMLPLQLLQAMTLFTLWMEKAAPFLLYSPFINAHFRMFLIISFVLFHIGLSMTFPLALFPYICIVYWISLLPSDFWDNWIPSVSQHKSVKMILKKTENFRLQLVKAFEVFPKNPEGFNFSANASRKIKFLGSAATNIFCIVAMVTALTWNIMNLKKSDNFRIPSPLFEMGYFLRVAQYWAMFAPFPYREDGWFVVNSKLFNETNWNTFHNIPATFDKPADVYAINGGSLWRKYMSYLPKAKYKQYLPYFGKWLCRSWNNRHPEPERINYTELYFMEQMVPNYPLTERTINKKLIWRHHCYSNPPKT